MFAETMALPPESTRAAVFTARPSLFMFRGIIKMSMSWQIGRFRLMFPALSILSQWGSITLTNSAARWLASSYFTGPRHPEAQRL
jgi:hypothetical protein